MSPSLLSNAERKLPVFKWFILLELGTFCWFTYLSVIYFQSSFYPPFSLWILESKLLKFRCISSRPMWWSQLLLQLWVGEKKKAKKRKKVQFDRDETVLFTLPHVDLNKHFGFEGVWVILSFRYCESQKKRFTSLLMWSVCLWIDRAHSLPCYGSETCNCLDILNAFFNF